MSADKKPAVPLSAFFRDKNFSRSYKHLLRQNNPAQAKLRDVLADELCAAAAKGVRFPAGRAESDATAHIRRLLAEYPALAHKPQMLYKLRDRAIINSMPARRWRSRVAAARK